MKLGIQETDKCFVVMPFGQKPFRDGSTRTYDFDKVYRVIIQRAIRQTGMQPIRADETIGSAIIHGAMFKDLRDQPVVLADLSLENPNVFYELGIRHVMSSSGTVLICAEGSTLPFDVNLSRVIFYKYDGQNLDWEEVERIVEKLQLALQQARQGEPDSPVHALLETVFKIYNQPSSNPILSLKDQRYEEELDKFQKQIAEFWENKKLSLENLYKNERGTIFGARALGYYCLNQMPLPKQSNIVAAHLADAQQYDLAVKIFSTLKEEGNLDFRDQLRYATAYSELNEHLNGAKQAIDMVKETLSLVNQSVNTLSPPNDRELTKTKALCNLRLSGLYRWKWQLTKDLDDLTVAIETAETVIRQLEQIRKEGNYNQPGQIAQVHLYVMLLLRIQENNIERVDVENHRDAILNIKPHKKEDSPQGISYLNWYQAITLADSGADEASKRKALATFVEDSKIMNDPDNWKIGRRQYAQLRRFIEQYSQFLRNTSIIGSISQILQVGPDR